jgi:hypothetical protein
MGLDELSVKHSPFAPLPLKSLCPRCQSLTERRIVTSSSFGSARAVGSMKQISGSAMEEGGGTSDTSASHGGGTVYISLPNAAADDTTPSSAQHRAVAPSSLPVHLRVTPPPPSSSHLQAAHPPPLPGAAVGDWVTHLPDVAEGGAPNPTPFLPWSAATCVEVWRLCSRR